MQPSIGRSRRSDHQPDHQRRRQVLEVSFRPTQPAYICCEGELRHPTPASFPNMFVSLASMDCSTYRDRRSRRIPTTRRRMWLGLRVSGEGKLRRPSTDTRIEETGLLLELKYDPKRRYYIRLRFDDVPPAGLPDYFVSVVRKKDRVECTTMTLMKRNHKVSRVMCSKTRTDTPQIVESHNECLTMSMSELSSKWTLADLD